MTDTIPAPAPEHDEKCRHTDCVGECCEPCANMPKAEENLTRERDELARKLEGAKAEVERLEAYARETYEFCASAATLESAKAEGRLELADDALEWLRHEAGK